MDQLDPELMEKVQEAMEAELDPQLQVQEATNADMEDEVDPGIDQKKHSTPIPTYVNFPSFSVSRMSNEEVKFYTGISMEVFQKLCKAYAKTRAVNKGHLNCEDQLLLILARLRLNLLIQDLAYRFQISESLCSTIFSNGIVKLAKILKDATFWLPKGKTESTMPEQFKELYPNTTCVIDCSEVLTQKPEGLMARAITKVSSRLTSISMGSLASPKNTIKMHFVLFRQNSVSCICK